MEEEQIKNWQEKNEMEIHGNKQKEIPILFYNEPLSSFVGLKLLGLLLVVFLISAIGYFDFRLILNNTSTNSVHTSSAVGDDTKETQKSDSALSDFMKTTQNTDDLIVDYEIPELNIKLRVPEEFSKDLVYLYENNDNNSGVVQFSTKSLTSLDNSCVTENSPLGILSAIFDKSSFESSWMFVPNVKPYPDPQDPHKAFFLNGIYMEYSGPQSPCVFGTDRESLQTSQIKLLKKSITTIQSIKNETTKPLIISEIVGPYIKLIFPYKDQQIDLYTEKGLRARVSWNTEGMSDPVGIGFCPEGSLSQENQYCTMDAGYPNTGKADISLPSGLPPGRWVAYINSIPERSVFATSEDSFEVLDPSKVISDKIETLISATAPVSTDDWKLYIDEAHGFSFRYPKDWEIEITDSSSVRGLYILSPQAKQESNEIRYGSPGFNVKVYKNADAEAKINGEEVVISGLRAIESGWGQSEMTGNYEKGIKILSSPAIGIYFWASFRDESHLGLFDPFINNFSW